MLDYRGEMRLTQPLASYNVFAGKDASRGLGLSSVKPEDAVPDYSNLSPEAQNTLDGWYDFFKCVHVLFCLVIYLRLYRKRYNIVGTVSDI